MIRSILVISFLLLLHLSAQTFKISGTVNDEKDQPLVGANILLKGTVIGTATNPKGEFELSKLKKKNYLLVISMIGYEKKEIDVNFNSTEIQHLTIKLKKESLRVNQVIITASKHQNTIRNLPVSASVINSERINEKNFITLDQALRYEPGIIITEDQISIRGSSGYSLGAGTRVLTAIDGIPLYTGDSGEIIWQLIPPSEIDRVEVVKGAASSMYGSTAMGGVVNVISKDITSKPLTYVKTFAGTYDKPRYDEWKWSNNLQSYFGATISHSRTMGKLGITGLFSYFQDDGYRKNDWEKRYSGYLKAVYNFNESTSLTFIGSGYSRDKGTFTYWRGINDALLPPEDEIGQVTPSDRFVLGFLFNHMFNEKVSLIIKPSLYNSYWYDASESANSSRSKLYRTEVQVNWTLAEGSLLVSGVEGQYNTVTSSIFGDRKSEGFGIYSQWEYRLSKSFLFTVGARYDYSKLDTLDSSSDISPKVGLNYKLSKMTILRASAGKGFRAPTLAEAFTSTTTSGITVKPNPLLKPEKSYSLEIGGNHKFSSLFLVDIALFDNEYENFIEPVIDPKDGNIVFENIANARVFGMETSGTLSLLNNKLISKVGYTNLNSKNLETGKELKYRPKHSVIFSMDYSISSFKVGFDFRYNSRVEEIDDALIDFGLVPDGDERVDIKVLDLRAGYKLIIGDLPVQVFLNANNLLNYNYVEMIGNLAPIRNYSLSIDFMF